MAHPDLDKLLDTTLPFAQQMVARHKEFYPFGSTMTQDGKTVSQAAYDGDEHPPSEQVIDMFTQSFRKQATEGRIRAAGICCMVFTLPPGGTEKTDAICVSLEHQSGESVDVFLPYKKGWRGNIEYGQIFASRRAQQFFGQLHLDG